MSVTMGALPDTLSLEYCDNGIEHHFVNPLPDVCQKLIESRKHLESLEKQKTMTLAIYSERGPAIYPKQLLAEEWNKRLNPVIDARPPSVEEQGSVRCKDDDTVTCIEGIWFDIGSIDPSFYDSNTIYVPENGHINVMYGYTLRKPKNKLPVLGIRKGPGPRPYYLESQKKSYCGALFQPLVDDSSVTLTINGVAQPHMLDSLVGTHANSIPFTVGPRASILTTTLHIRDRIRVILFDWIPISEFSWACLPIGLDQYQERKDISASRIVTRYENYDNSYSLQIQDADSEPVVTFSTTLPEYALQVGTTKLTRSKYKYHVEYSHAPFNYLHVSRAKDPYTVTADMNVMNHEDDQFVFEVDKEDLELCLIYPYNPFDNYLKRGDEEEKTLFVCEETEPSTTTPMISIKTNQSWYETKDLMLVKIDITKREVPAEGEATIQYGDQTVVVPLVDGLATVLLTPKVAERRIYVEYEGKRREYPVYVTNTGRYWNAATFFGGLIGFYLLFKLFEHTILQRRIWGK